MKTEKIISKLLYNKNEMFRLVKKNNLNNSLYYLADEVLLRCLANT